MSNQVTKLSDVINPQVMGAMIEAKIEALCKITPYAKVDTTLQGVPGDTKTVPSWNYIGDAQDFDPENGNGDEIETAKLTASSTTFGIKCAGKAVSILQTAINSGLGNPIGQAETQLAKAIVGKVDNDVLAAAYTSGNIFNGSGDLIGYKPIVEAVGKFGDEEETDKVMFIHPDQETTLLKDSDFISADKFEAGVAVRGSIGKIAGCWIKKSKKVTKSNAVTAVQGVYTATVAGTLASGDKISVGGVEITLDSTSAASPTAAVTALKTAVDADAGFAAKYTTSKSSGVLTITEKSGAEGSGIPAMEITSTAGTITGATTTKGVAGVAACYNCPIIKMEPDSPETEYTEDELPALTIFLKKDTQVDHEWFPKKQRHDVTAAKYYGVALTNASKVVVAKFGVVAAS